MFSSTKTKTLWICGASLLSNSYTQSVFSSSLTRGESPLVHTTYTAGKTLAKLKDDRYLETNNRRGYVGTPYNKENAPLPPIKNGLWECLEDPLAYHKPRVIHFHQSRGMTSYLNPLTQLGPTKDRVTSTPSARTNTAKTRGRKYHQKRPRCLPRIVQSVRASCEIQARSSSLNKKEDDPTYYSVFLLTSTSPGIRPLGSDFADEPDDRGFRNGVYNAAAKSASSPQQTPWTSIGMAESSPTAPGAYHYNRTYLMFAAHISHRRAGSRTLDSPSVRPLQTHGLVELGNLGDHVSPRPPLSRNPCASGRRTASSSTERSKSINITAPVSLSTRVFGLRTSLLEHLVLECPLHAGCHLHLNRIDRCVVA
ncbi:hypothetical protein ACRALDRAFT_213037 [Sodiomyces alcalophilus JCM 7366]|uniref:uncharacterized protein n=1 Tax=Sodiomyces alcalophilus JCM 7366 TaxID=591952 RepID=UPI0039B6D1FB